MKKRYASWMAMMLLLAGAGPILAQAQGDDRPPPPRGEDNRPNPPSPRDDRDSRRPEDQDRVPVGRSGGVPVGEAAAPQVRAMMGYLQLVNQYKQLTADPTAAGVAAVVTAGDVLRHRGPDAAIAFFEKVLPDVTDSSIRNAIHLQLADFYRASGKEDKALEHLTALMTEAGKTAK
ncbi:MAG TPA: hypothetical protein VFE58_06395 [Tepidisphaeraceae bacterium]|jgi:hypothetical protein|nr:hypothetical protein [Tepidisphaeraceae bacterium]